MVNAKPEDVATPEAVIKALYEVISGPKEQPRDWARFRSLYTPEAQMVIINRNEDGSLRREVLNVEGYEASRAPFFAANDFYEQEIGGHIDRFANIAHVFSAYEGRRSPEGPAFLRGINSFQLFNDGSRWWLAAAMWQREDEQNLLPSELG